jgi:peptidoglycan/xylan/chitin deacetylase (PgdA/CDA1 family)
MATARLPVLLYHNVAPMADEEWRGLTVTPASFERQIAMLRGAGYDGISCAQWLAHIDGVGPLPRKPVLITFDDAYASLAEHALPVITHEAWSAEVFVPTSLIGAEIRRDAPDSRCGLPVMDQRQICEWTERGIEFGAHSRTHRDLTTLTEEELNDEIEGSRSDLEDVTGRTVRAFAYPYGKRDERVTAAVRRTYSAAFTLESGINDSHSDRYAIRRSMVQHSDSAVEVWLRVSAGWNPMDALKTTAMKWRKRATA